MTEQKPDDLSSTGSHRVWNPTLGPGAATRNWIPPVTRPAAPVTPPQTSRHAAITRSLKNFPSYKSWADKVKNSWKPDKE